MVNSYKNELCIIEDREILQILAILTVGDHTIIEVHTQFLLHCILLLFNGKIEIVPKMRSPVKYD